MKILLTLSIAFLCSFAAVAQDATSWSAPINVLSFRVQDLIFFKNHGYVLRVNGDGFVYSKKNKSILQQFDNKLGFKKELDIKLMYEGEKAEPVKMISINDKLYLLYSGYADKEERLLLSEIDTDNLNFTGDPIVLGTVKSSRSQILMKQSKNGRFFSVIGYWGEDGKSKAYVTCYDSNFQLLYEDQQDINLKYTSGGCTQLEVDNEGNTFAIMEEFNFIAEDDPPVLWQRYKSGESLVSTAKAENSAQNIRTARMLVSDEIVLVMSYFTEQELRKDRTKGISFIAYDKKTKGNAKQAEVSLPKEDIVKYIEKLMSTNRYKASEQEVPALTLVELQDWEGHGYIVVGERRYFHLMPDRTSIAMSAVNFVSLIDYSLSKILWTIPVCKYFPSGDFRNGLHLTLNKNRAHVFFNSINNINKKHDSAPLYGDGLIGMTIDPIGKYSTRVLYGKDDKMIVQLGYTVPIDGESWFILAGKAYKEKVGILRP